MKHIVSLIVFCLLLTNCAKKEVSIPDCNLENPLEELDWLKEKKDSLSCACNSSIAQGLYNGQEVFYIITPSFYCDAAGVTLWDCNGNVVREILYANAESDLESVITVEILYSCEE